MKKVTNIYHYKCTLKALRLKPCFPQVLWFRSSPIPINYLLVYDVFAVTKKVCCRDSHGSFTQTVCPFGYIDIHTIFDLWILIYQSKQSRHSIHQALLTLLFVALPAKMHITNMFPTNTSNFALVDILAWNLDLEPRAGWPLCRDLRRCSRVITWWQNTQWPNNAKYREAPVDHLNSCSSEHHGYSLSKWVYFFPQVTVIAIVKPN